MAREIVLHVSAKEATLTVPRYEDICCRVSVARDVMRHFSVEGGVNLGLNLSKQCLRWRPQREGSNAQGYLIRAGEF
jgi:hypothetical protein